MGSVTTVALNDLIQLLLWLIDHKTRECNIAPGKGGSKKHSMRKETRSLKTKAGPCIKKNRANQMQNNFKL